MLKPSDNFVRNRFSSTTSTRSHVSTNENDFADEFNIPQKSYVFRNCMSYLKKPNVYFIMKLQLVFLSVYVVVLVSILKLLDRKLLFRPIGATTDNKFLSFLHPFVEAHPHLHWTFEGMIRKGILISMIQWLLLLLVFSKLRNNSKMFRYFFSVIKSWEDCLGLITTSLLFYYLTGTICGGISHKAVLFPDNVWGSLFRSLFVSSFKSEKDVFLFFSKKSFVFAYPRPFLKVFQSLFSSNGVQTLLDVFTAVKTILSTISFKITSLLTLLFILDISGMILAIYTSIRFTRFRSLALPIGILSIVFSLSYINLVGIPSPNSNEAHWVDFSKLSTNFNLPGKMNYPVLISKYISMSDKVKLAADIYLPSDTVLENLKLAGQLQGSFDFEFYSSVLNLNNLKIERFSERKSGDAKIPTFLITTRYNRRMTLSWPFTFMSVWGQPPFTSSTNIWCWQFVNLLVANGYAVVVVDSRGTGASCGHRPVDFSPREVQDLPEIHDWIKEQFWYNGKLGAGGFSYDGMTGLHLAATREIDVVAALFTPINVVNDLIQPGGLVCSSFVQDYTGLTLAFERTGTPLSHMLNDASYDIPVVLGFALSFGLAAPVLGEVELLDYAIMQHHKNWNMTRMVEDLHFMDDLVSFPFSGDTKRMQVGEFGITKPIIDSINKFKTSVYVVGGYCDSSSIRGVARLFESLTDNSESQTHQLVIGPWSHTGRRTCSPYGSGTYPSFEDGMYFDFLRFLDCQLSSNCWGPERLKTESVHAWIVGQEEWLSSDSFPPKTVKEKDFTFHKETAFEKAKLVEPNFVQPLKQEFSTQLFHPVSYRTAIHGVSRWVIAKHPFRMLPNSAAEPRTDYLQLDSEPLGPEGLRLVGSPLVRFSVDMREEADKMRQKVRESLQGARVFGDAEPVAIEIPIFGYLEDVDNNTGQVHQVTEGRILLSHRPTVANSNLSGMSNWDSCSSSPLERVSNPNDTTLRQRPRLGSADVVFQEGTRANHEFTTGGIECVVFTFEPVVWFFQPNHSIRVSFSGGDVSNFNWLHTSSKENHDFLASQIGQKKFLEVGRAKTWSIPINTKFHPAFIKLPIFVK